MSATPGPGEPRIKGPGRVQALDGIRGIAILWVFSFHSLALLGGGLGAPDAGWTAALAEKGLLGVQLFFVLSGYLLAMAWIRAAATGGPSPAIGRFYGRRAARILPAYWLHLAFLFGVLLPLLREGYAVLGTEVGRTNLILHPLLLQFVHPGTSSSLGLNMALWSLTIEGQFYLLLPLLAPLFCGRRMLLALPAALAISLAWKTLAPTMFSPWVYLNVPPALLVFFDPVSGRGMPFPADYMGYFLQRQLPGELLAFALGMTAANLHVRLGSSRRLQRLAELGGLALLALGPWLLARLDLGQVLDGEQWRLLGMPLFLLGCALLVLAAGLGTPLVRRLLSIRPLVWVGVVSYSLYLWHEPVLRLVRLWWPGGQEEAPGVAILCALAASLVIATLSYWLTERPRTARRGKKWPHPLGSPLVATPTPPLEPPAEPPAAQY